MTGTAVDFGAGPAGRAAVLLSSEGRGWHDVQAAFLQIPAGKTEVPGQAWHRIGVHFGRSVQADCQCDGRRLRRVQAHGDVDVVPAGVEGSWEDDASCRILRLAVNPALIGRAAAELGLDPARTKIRPRLQLRDAGIEAIAWAIKAELEASAAADRLYADTLGMALAVRLIAASHGAQAEAEGRRGLSPAQRRRLLAYVEAHLDQPLSLADLADVAGLGISQLKTLFGRSFGMPVHRFVVRRRVERAKALLLAGELPASQIALACGFAHQSHMAHCMRRVLGLTPGAVARMRG